MDSKKIIFSKQSDHDLPLVPFWLHWYTEVFQADVIIITPVKTLNSSIEGILHYYSRKGFPVHPILIDEWNDSLIWSAQKDLIRPYLPSKGNFIALSADTDQFFEPFSSSGLVESSVFRRVNLIGSSVPSIEELQDMEVVAVPSYELIGGYKNSLDDPQIGVTGHYFGAVDTTKPIPFEFHFGLRGFHHYAEKVTSLAIADDTLPEADAWKRARRVFNREGIEGLKHHYEEMVEKARREPQSTSLVQLFKSYNKGTSLSCDKLDRRYPFSSAVIACGFNEGSGPLKRSGFLLPQQDVPLMREIMERGRYEAPLLNKVSSDSFIVDIGAHVGLFTLYAFYSYPQARFLCIEPTPESFHLLLRNVNNIPFLEAFNVAVADFEGQGLLCRHPHCPEKNFLRRASHKNDLSCVEVPILHVGKLFTSLGVAEVSLLKISAGGSEVDILRGVAEYLPKIRIVLLEVHSHAQRRSAEALLRDFTLFDFIPIGTIDTGAGIAKYLNKALKS